MTNSRKMWSPTDPKHYEGKTLKELQDSLVNAETFVKNHPKFEYGWHNEYRQELKKYIAERIGKK
jgi:hypothetical protein